MNEEELQPKSNQWAPDDEGAKKGELNPKRISEQEFAYAIDQLKIPNCKSPGRLAGGFMGQMAGYGNHTVPSSKFQVPSSKFQVQSNGVQSSEDEDYPAPPPMPKKLLKLVELLIFKTPEIYQPAVACAIFPPLATHL